MADGPQTDRFLVLDARVVDFAEGLVLELGQATKDDHNPLFGEEAYSDPPKPWESRFDNFYPNVIWDADRRQFRLWYFCFIKDPGCGSVPPSRRTRDEPSPEKSREEGLLFACSGDGIRWEKPDLGLIEFEGSRDNNIVMSASSHGIHAGGVMRDDCATDPARLYKVFYKTKKEMAVAFSPDGLSWSDPVPWPEHTAVGDTHNNAFWDEKHNRYVGITRGWADGVRTVQRTDSTDFVNWSRPVEILRGQDAHDQIYTMPVFPWANAYIGLPAIFHKGNPQADDWDTVHTELAWSPDTLEWHRICPGQALIPRGSGQYPTGAYDCGCVYPSVPVDTNNEMLLYYGGSNGQHNAWREGSLNLARLRQDGFAGLSAGHSSGPGRMGTSVFRVGTASADFTVNADIPTGGMLRVAVQDDEGHGIRGYGLDDCAAITEGGISVSVAWKDRHIRELAGQTVRFLFELEALTLYGFSGALYREGIV